MQYVGLGSDSLYGVDGFVDSQHRSQGIGKFSLVKVSREGPLPTR